MKRGPGQHIEMKPQSKERKKKQLSKNEGGLLRLVDSISQKWLVVSFLSGNLNISIPLPLLRKKLNCPELFSHPN